MTCKQKMMEENWSRLVLEEKTEEELSQTKEVPEDPPPPKGLVRILQGWKTGEKRKDVQHNDPQHKPKRRKNSSMTPYQKTWAVGQGWIWKGWKKKNWQEEGC